MTTMTREEAKCRVSKIKDREARIAALIDDKGIARALAELLEANTDYSHVNDYSYLENYAK